MTDEVDANIPVEAVEPPEPAAPIENRFLFVDVAAQRAKQLRRGSVPRLADAGLHASPHKLERVAMEEVRGQLVHYSLPENDPPATEGDA